MANASGRWHLPCASTGRRNPEAGRRSAMLHSSKEEMMHHTLPYIAASFSTTGRIAALALAVVTCLAGRAAVAQQNDVAEGKRIWAEKGQCVDCHGWAGDGERSSLHSP